MTVLRQMVIRAQRTPGHQLYATDPAWQEALTMLDASLVTDSSDAATLVVVPDRLGLPSLRDAKARGSKPQKSGDREGDS
jgi:hypothetical protein